MLAVTDADHTNLHIAVTAKLLNPEVMVIARAENEETRDNMASFGTDHIINPYETFAGGFLLAIEAPNAHRLYAWMSSRRELPEGSERLPRQGCWIICGFSALGRALYERFSEFGLRTVIVDPEEPRELPASQPFVAGKGTEAATLQEAGIAGDGVAGVIAATDDDTDNLSIAVTARELVPTLYVVARQNHATNRHIFAAAKVDMVMESNRVIALRMLRLLATPMLPQFLHLIRGRDEQWLGTLVERWGHVSARPPRCCGA
ncbi:MAG: NAD-binding protein [Arhodomonas sp.]|nr:NAD-binding protein [Arhodomonas sp.]